MDCPVCKSAMIVLELEEVEIDYCLECRGIWLDSGELEMFLEDKGKAAELISSFESACQCGEKARKCPICTKQMEKILAGPKDGQIMIDRCRSGHGLWFDHGELNQIVNLAASENADRISRLLADMFSSEAKD